MALPPQTYPTRAERYRFTGEAVRRLASAPGIVAAGAIDAVPIGEDRQGTAFAVDGAAATAADEDAHTGIAFPGPGYFEAVGLPVRRGRTFTAADGSDAPPVAILSDTLARQAFGSANPVGRRVRVGFNRQIAREIVGVVADDHFTGVGRPLMPNVYLPYEQVAYTGGQSVVVRSTADPATTIATVRRELTALDPAAAIYNVRTLEQIVSDSIATERFSTLLLAAFALIALTLALVGVYGVTDETVRQRAQELGIRMALGAEPARILRLVVGGGVRLALAGVAIGLVGALLLSRFLTTLLFGVSALDARAYAGTAVLLAAAATLAAYGPARRATRIQLNAALRGE
jgi:putative ABC transport system permease protein